jgi:hypothetical protein
LGGLIFTDSWGLRERTKNTMKNRRRDFRIENSPLTQYTSICSQRPEPFVPIELRCNRIPNRTMASEW